MANKKIICFDELEKHSFTCLSLENNMQRLGKLNQNQFILIKEKGNWSRTMFEISCITFAIAKDIYGSLQKWELSIKESVN